MPPCLLICGQQARRKPEIWGARRPAGRASSWGRETGQPAGPPRWGGQPSRSWRGCLAGPWRWSWTARGAVPLWAAMPRCSGCACMQPSPPGASYSRTRPLKASRSSAWRTMPGAPAACPCLLPGAHLHDVILPSAVHPVTELGGCIGSGRDMMVCGGEPRHMRMSECGVSCARWHA